MRPGVAGPAAALAETSPAPGRPAQGPLVELRGISKRYDGLGGSIVALDAVDLAFRSGELIVILGPSGSGKTTLLNLIGALDRPTSGSLVVAGHDLSRASAGQLRRYRRESVSFVFQTFNLFPSLTALENVEFGAAVAGRPNPAATARETLARTGLELRLAHFPNALSGGEQQRVAIARALATGNPIVLADEPTGELDFQTGRQILELLRAQAADGRLVILVTHNREISRVADRVVELSSGRVVSDGPPPGVRPAISELRW